MAQDLNRAGDTPIATLLLNEIAPKNWRRYPPRVGDMTPVNENYAKPRYLAADYIGGVKGDDVDQQTANVAVASASGAANAADYTPRTQAAKATSLGTTIVADVTRPRGVYPPNQGYFTGGATVSAPTVTSVSPNTAAAGSNPVFVVITGTNFFPQTKVITGGGVGSPWDAEARWISTTQMSVVIDPRGAVPGAISVAVEDHEVMSNTDKVFTFT